MAIVSKGGGGGGGAGGEAAMDAGGGGEVFFAASIVIGVIKLGVGAHEFKEVLQLTLKPDLRHDAAHFVVDS